MFVVVEGCRPGGFCARHATPVDLANASLRTSLCLGCPVSFYASSASTALHIERVRVTAGFGPVPDPRSGSGSQVWSMFGDSLDAAETGRGENRPSAHLHDICLTEYSLYAIFRLCLS